MRKKHAVAPRLLGLITLSVLGSPVVAGACGGSSNVSTQQNNAGGTGGTVAGRGGTSGKGSSGRSGRAGTGGNGAQGGTRTGDGGEAGESTGGITSGASGVGGGRGGNGAGSGGSAAASGGNAGNAMAGMGGASGASAGGSQGGTAGQSGDAGSSVGIVGVLGTECSPPGALACAGNHQKLTVLCGANGQWQPNQTCAADLYCDSTPGPNVGLCAPVADGCDSGPGTVFCSADEKQVVTCGPDAVTRSEKSCDGACHRGLCRDDLDPCPDWDAYDDGTACTMECGVPPYLSRGGCFRSQDDCYSRLFAYPPGVVRTPWSDDVCSCELVEGRALVLALSRGQNWRVTVPSPWSLGRCGEAPVQCVVTDYLNIEMWTPVLDAGPVNIVVEQVGEGDICP